MTDRTPIPAISCGGSDALPPALLAPRAGDKVRLESPGAGLRQFVCFARWDGWAICDAEGDADERWPDRPIALALVDGGVVATPSPNAAAHPRLLAASSWIRSVPGLPVTIDLGRLPHVNSQLVAWILRIAQAHGQTRIRVTGMSPATLTQLRQLRLEHLVTLG
jgi:hypothetical protein